jgi:hypothetical protein
MKPEQQQVGSLQHQLLFADAYGTTTRVIMPANTKHYSLPL